MGWKRGEGEQAISCDYLTLPAPIPTLVRRSKTLYRTATLGMGLETWSYQICSAAHILWQSITGNSPPQPHIEIPVHVTPPFPMLGLAIMVNLR